MTHGSQGYDPSSTMQSIAETMGYLENKKEQKSQTVKRVWQGPKPGVIKLNSDGAINEVEAEWVDAPPDFLSHSLRADCTNLISI